MYLRPNMVSNRSQTHYSYLERTLVCITYSKLVYILNWFHLLYLNTLRKLISCTHESFKPTCLIFIPCITLSSLILIICFNEPYFWLMAILPYLELGGSILSILFTLSLRLLLEYQLLNFGCRLRSWKRKGVINEKNKLKNDEKNWKMKNGLISCLFPWGSFWFLKLKRFILIP